VSYEPIALSKVRRVTPPPAQNLQHVSARRHYSLTSRVAKGLRMSARRHLNALLCVSITVGAGGFGCTAEAPVTDDPTEEAGSDEELATAPGLDDTDEADEADATPEDLTFVNAPTVSEVTSEAEFIYANGAIGEAPCRNPPHANSTFGGTSGWPHRAVNECGTRVWLYQFAHNGGAHLCLNPHTQTGTLHRTYRWYFITTSKRRCP
jgi:hypothetical protein